MIPALNLFILRLGKLFFALRSPLTFRALLYRVGASTEHLKALRNRQFATILDVGANRGQFALLCRTLYPQARIVSFEPLPRPANIYRYIFSGDDLVELNQTALGAVRGRLDMHVASDDDSSSILEIGRRQTQAFGTREVERFPVVVERLDELVDGEDLVSPVLLKIDVQGFEAHVLRGAEKLLPAIDAVYVESSFVELYEGQALFADVWGLVSESGFSMQGVFNQHCNRAGVPLQADFLFIRAPVKPETEVAAAAK